MKQYVKGYIIILIFLFFAVIYSVPVQSAANETIIRGWIKAEDKTVNGEVYSFVLSDEPKYVVMQYDNTLIKASPPSCETRDYIQLCVDDVQLNRTDPVTNVKYYRAFVTVIRLDADIIASRTASLIEGIVGDSFEILTEFQNIGKRKAENVSFIDKFPDSFIIDLIKFNLDKSDCIVDLDKNSIFLVGQLESNQRVKCRYTIIPNEAGIYKLESNLTYNNGVLSKSVFFSPIVLNVKNGTLEIQKSVSKIQMEITDIFVLNSTLTNLFVDNNTEVLFKVEVPKEIRILNKTFEFEREGNIVFWLSKLDKGKEINLSLALMPVHYGNFRIPVTASYSSSGKDFIFIKKVNITSYAKSLDIMYKISANKLNSSQNFSFYIALKSNTNKYYYKSIQASLISDMPTFEEITLIFDKPVKNYSTLIVFNGSIIAPEVSRNTTFNITLNLEYETEFEQEIKDTRNYAVYVVEFYKPSEVKFFNIPLTALNKSKADQAIPGLKLDEQKISEQILQIIPKTPKGIIMTVVMIIILAISVFVYLRKDRHNP